MMDYINKNVQKGDSILFLGGHWGTQYFYPNNMTYGMDTFDPDFYSNKDLNFILERLKEKKVEYIVYVRGNFIKGSAGREFYTAPVMCPDIEFDWLNRKDISKSLRRIHETDSSILYKVIY